MPSTEMQTIKTNDLKKGDMVILRNGWKARIEDNKKGTRRMATVFGLYTEMGSIYAHDIQYKIISGNDLMGIELTPNQIDLKRIIARI